MINQRLPNVNHYKVGRGITRSTNETYGMTTNYAHVNKANNTDRSVDPMNSTATRINTHEDERPDSTVNFI